MSFKKKVFSGVMLSAVTLSALAPITPITQPIIAHADTTANKIATAEATIANAQASSAEAQAALNTIQASVDAANARAAQLQTESEATTAQIDALREVIIQRNEILKKQARSAQTNGSVTSYINTVLNAKSMTDALQRVTAMSQVVQANSDMMEQQKKDKAELETKQAENEKAYKEATDLQKQLAVQQHDLEAAKALYSATIASTQEEKDQLLAQQASEIAAAQAAAAAQKAVEDAAAQKAAQQQAASQSTQTSQSSSSSTGSAPAVSVTDTGTLVPTVSSSSSGNPLWQYAGQCTWGVYEILGPNLRIYSGNAGNWAAYANTDKPAPNEIVVFSPAQAGNPYGHVAVIQSVNADGTVNVREANYNNNPNVTYRSNVSVVGSAFIIPTYN
ncbi:CHAP domain-containing protein [Lactovum odontotermitis]